MLERRKVALVVLVVSLAASVAACGNLAELPDSMGSVDFSFLVSGRLALNRIDYTVEGDGFGPVTGTIPLDDRSATVSAVVGGIPTGSGYQVTLAGTTDDRGTFCQGVAAFDVVAPAPSAMTISLVCVNPNTIRTVYDRGVAHICPAIGSTAVARSPSAITLSASAFSFDDAPLSFLWDASSGTLGTPGAAISTYRCSAAGPAHLRVTVTDGHCPDAALVDVTCPSAL